MKGRRRNLSRRSEGGVREEQLELEGTKKSGVISDSGSKRWKLSTGIEGTEVREVCKDRKEWKQER